MHMKTDTKPVEIFLENDQRLEFIFILGPKNWASEAHILHASKGTCNEHVKQYWCEASENVLRKWPNTRILTSLGPKMAQKLGIWGPYCTHLWK